MQLLVSGQPELHSASVDALRLPWQPAEAGRHYEQWSPSPWLNRNV